MCEYQLTFEIYTRTVYIYRVGLKFWSCPTYPLCRSLFALEEPRKPRPPSVDDTWMQTWICQPSAICAIYVCVCIFVRCKHFNGTWLFVLPTWSDVVEDINSGCDKKSCEFYETLKKKTTTFETFYLWHKRAELFQVTFSSAAFVCPFRSFLRDISTRLLFIKNALRNFAHFKNDSLNI